MKQIRLNVTMKVSNMYEFLLRHSYSGWGGVGSVLFSLALFVYLIVGHESLNQGQTILVTFGALLFTVINPVVILFNATKQVKLNPTFRDLLTYTLSEEGILVEQNGQELLVKWEEVQKVVETKQSVIIYLTKVRAFILPKYVIADDMNEVKEIIAGSMLQEKCKWKKA